MKVVAINEIHYTDRAGRAAVAAPAQVFDIPGELAELLLSSMAVRRLTESEIAFDKLQAEARAAKTDDDDDEEGEGEGTEAAAKEAAAKAPAAKAPAKEATAAKGAAGTKKAADY